MMNTGNSDWLKTVQPNCDLRINDLSLHSPTTDGFYTWAFSEMEQEPEINYFLNTIFFIISLFSGDLNGLLLAPLYF